MSLSEQAMVAILSQLALSCDGAILGVALAYAAIRSVLKFASTSSALRKLRKAPSVKVSDLRSILAADGPSDGSNGSQQFDGKFVIVCGKKD